MAPIVALPLFESHRVHKGLFETLLLTGALTLLMSGDALGHDAPEHLDPELLTGWRTWLHLTIQWSHLVAFALWLGLTAGTLLLRINARLDHLLYSSWILFLVLLATGTYNMEWSAGISETPSLFLLPLLEKVPYGVTYTVVLAVKVGLYALAVLLTLLITIFHLQHKVPEARLRKIFLLSQSYLAIMTALVAAIVLFYHEVADLWPTRFHSWGGVMGPEGPRGQMVVGQDGPPPNDFRLLATRDAWIDIGLRWVHLLGFGLWSGSSAWVLSFGGVSAGRFLLFSWILLVIQILSGMVSMGRWTPFYLPPYVWNLHDLSQIRFGNSYTLFMATKHILVGAVISLVMMVTLRYLRSHRKAGANSINIQPVVVLILFLGFAIGYIMVIVLLLHEGVDHAL